jgi:hypothetical protein
VTDGAQPQGHGKLAVGVLAAFGDAQGDGQYTQPKRPKDLCAAHPEEAGCDEWSKPQDVLRGQSPFLLLFNQGLDAQAVKELDTFLSNPQALKPGLNLAHVRCKAEVPAWKQRFDPIEVIDLAQPITIESFEAIKAKVAAHELCVSWT